MGLNSICEFGQRDADVTRVTRHAARVQRNSLIRVLRRAKTQGELSSDADLDSMAAFFESTLAGLRIVAKAGQSRQALRNIATIAGTAFRRSATTHGTDPRSRRCGAGRASGLSAGSRMQHLINKQAAK